jgi:hypothetical protein
MVYMANLNSTFILVPIQLRPFIGKVIDLGTTTPSSSSSHRTRRAH